MNNRGKNDDNGDGVGGGSFFNRFAFLVNIWIGSSGD